MKDVIGMNNRGGVGYFRVFMCLKKLQNISDPRVRVISLPLGT